ncbi:MAG: hypothetical protein NTX67_12230 [Burkholderiales bacterium]|nr:hypothetical protein [Burkholderiales bacterium]
MSEFGARGQDSSSEFFFRVTDRLQMESCLTALAQDGKSVVISSDSNELIDHYGAAFVRRIKQKLPQTQLEVFLPRDTEAMLERFNQLLNTLSLDVATKLRTGMAPEKVWVVHDANAMGGHEIQLLTRLIQQFPGAGISVILMFTEGTSQGDAIASQNKQFISWSLERPTAEQKLATIQQARKNGQEDAAVDFFNRLSKSAVKKLPAAAGSTASAAPVASKAATQQPPSKKTRQTAKSFAVVAAIGALLCVSLGVAFWLNPEVGDQILAKVTDIVEGSGKPQQKEDKQTPNTAGADAKEVPPGAPNLSQLEPKVELVPGPLPPTTSPASPPLPPPEPAKEVAVKVITELPEVAVKGRLWLKSLPADGFVLEHESFETVKEARAFIKDKEWLINARIAPVFTLGKDEARFAVMTGPFRSVERAKNTISRLKLSSNVTITSVQIATNQSELNKPNKP